MGFLSDNRGVRASFGTHPPSNEQQLPGSTGFGFPPQIIEVETGEDVASKVLSFTQNCPRDVCILSATGVLSNVSLIKTDTSGEATTFEIIVGEFVANGQVPITTNQQQMRGSIGSGVIQHIITVKTGEDVSSKIVAFIHSSPRAVCIVSATGELSNVTVFQADASGGEATYEGLFKIQTLSGSFLPFENGDPQSRMGGFSVSLTGSDQRTFGGAVSGDLIAASPVEVIVCSFAAPAAPMNPKFVVPSRGMHSGLPSELAGHPKGKRSGNRKR
ncbi:AT-hook motif nuclear-localized protein 10-like isoform X2 [Solanum stenotomum]|uniref:AT-hook motif nuclear-localized protein 10-like isoform X2 n=1 Tax=Solanum stenotomum TaxID=172797 RepID=UPI0020D1174E|nr:AT-hook motif nuclear-localized protein 10-like isoform X2 [Solanum stenotomum]